MPIPGLNRILVVEDDLDIQDILKYALETMGGFTVQFCAEGREALNQIVNFRPDLILLDMHLPHWDGLTILKVLRKQGYTTPAIFLTADTNLGNRLQYRELGVLEILSKPFNARTLAMTLRNIWQKATPPAALA